MGNFSLDLRYALRALAKTPGFTLATVLTLALGIGANTAIFSVVRGVLLRPLAFPQPERLTTLWLNMEARGGPRDEWAGRRVFVEWRRRNHSFAGLAVITGWAPDLSGGDRPENIVAGLVSPGFFSVLGVQPALGRGFLPEEETEASSYVAVLSDGLFRRRFAADPAVVGRDIVLNGRSYRVVGVLPPGFRSPLASDAQLFAPLDIDPTIDDVGSNYLRVIGRLRSAVTRQAAQADMDRVARRLEEAFPDYLKDVGVSIVPLQETVVGPARPYLLALLGAVLLVLAIACANVANLFLARSTARHRELAVRAALGAPRWCLVRQLLAESLLLAATGGAAGMLLGAWGKDLLVLAAPAGAPRLGEVRLDAAVFAFTALASLATGLVFGLLPALTTARPRLLDSLRQGPRSGASAGRGRLRTALVVVELALGLALLVGAGLLIRTLGSLSQVDPGFSAQDVTAGRLRFPSARYPEVDGAVAALDRVLEGLASQPGVEAVGAVTPLPLSGSQEDVSVGIEGRLPARGREPGADYRVATPGYFAALRIPLMAGRLFDAGDRRDALPVALVSERFAERFFPGEEALGKRLRIGDVQSPEARWWTIVGVVGGVRDNRLGRAPDPEVYVPFAQRPSRGITVTLRSGLSPGAAAATLRQTVAAVDPEQAVAGIATFDELLARSLAPTRYVTMLLASFALAALLLAAVGIYGVVAYAVGQRRREIGIRMAMGARGADVHRMVLRWGGRLVAAGLLLGMAAALGLAQLLSSLLYGVGPTDPLTLGAVSALLAAVTLGACSLPARRAARVDPMVTLRSE